MITLQIGGERSTLHKLKENDVQLRLNVDGSNFFLTIPESEDQKRRRIHLVIDKDTALDLLKPLLGSVNLRHILRNHEVVQLALMIATGHKAHHDHEGGNHD